MHRRDRHITDRALAIDSFNHFCTQQQLRLMQQDCIISQMGTRHQEHRYGSQEVFRAYAENTRLTEDDIIAAYRETKLGPCLDDRDRRDGLVQVTIRG